MTVLCVIAKKIGKDYMKNLQKHLRTCKVCDFNIAIGEAKKE